MDFKVGVSLWSHASQDDRQQQPMDPGRTPNFRDKLALDSEPQQALFEPERMPVAQPLSSTFQMRVPPSSLAAETYQRLETSDPSAARMDSTRNHGEAEAVELYALGALAGHHLSQLPDLFVSSAGPAGVAGSPTAISGVTLPNATVGLLPQTASAGAAERTQPAQLLSRQQASEDAGSPSPARQLESYLSVQWPERRVQVIARGRDETELLVRDYHLDAEEQDALVADLRRHVASMPKQPAQIWLNGQSIWQQPIAAHKE